MKTIEKTLKESPWQIEFRMQQIGSRMQGQDQWMLGSRHYRCEIWRKSIDHLDIHAFEYSQGPAYTNDPSLPDLMYALLEDARVIHNCEDEWDMAKEYGYKIDCKESYKKVQEMYKACEEAHSWLNSVFSEEEIDQLYKMFEDY